MCTHLTEDRLAEASSPSRSMLRLAVATTQPALHPLRVRKWAKNIVTIDSSSKHVDGNQQRRDFDRNHRRSNFRIQRREAVVIRLGFRRSYADVNRVRACP